MREIIVTVGPQASGKSSFCERVVTLDPLIMLVSRDTILTELFGGTLLSSYTDAHMYALEQMWEVVEEQLKSSSLKMILDTWNGSSDERHQIIRKLRYLGADRITAWYFVTPIESVEAWFWQKPGIAKIGEMRTRKDEGLVFYLEDAPRRDYEIFHRLASGITSEGFDAMVKINPLVMRPEQVAEF
ncbi:MAG: ATP-binding protein [Patescibacteria group bacterium]|nr:ATP-binding protein [Patescibacteria group bacterium]